MDLLYSIYRIVCYVFDNHNKYKHFPWYLKKSSNNITDINPRTETVIY